MLDRSRQVQLGCAALCFALFAVLAVSVVQGWGPITSIDDRGGPAETWAVDSHWLRLPLRWVEVAFGTVGMTIFTLVLATFMFVKHYRRAAYFTLGVMVVTAVATTLLKMLVDRVRPPWQNPDDFLNSLSFPSGHASSVAALGGVVLVLVGMLVRRANVRRAAYVAVVLVILVVGADRVLLGRHYPSDVIAGYLLGFGILLLGLAVYDPRPRSLAVSAEPLPEVYASERRLAVILNPAKVEDVGQFESIVTAMAVEAGWSEPTWHYTTIEDPGTGMA